MSGKWSEEKGAGDARATSGNAGTGAYTPRYARTPAKFSPKRSIKSFRDLDVYRESLECSVIVGKNLVPALKEAGFPLVEGMTNCALSVPLLIAEAHGMRFSNFASGVATLEKAMQGCSKMVVYLEEARGLCDGLDATLIETLLSRYLQTRGKMLRLEKSWQKFKAAGTPGTGTR